MGKNDQNARRVFGDTNRADGVPDSLAPSDGPVYLEGRLVLSLSFRGCFTRQGEDAGACWGESSGDGLGEGLDACQDEAPSKRLDACWVDGSGEVLGEGLGELIERYRLWDDLLECWWESGLEIRRFEMADVALHLGCRPCVLWQGALDTRARVIPVPDLDEAGMAANRSCDLCWKPV